MTLFSQITTVLERLENMEREWKTSVLEKRERMEGKETKASSPKDRSDRRESEDFATFAAWPGAEQSTSGNGLNSGTGDFAAPWSAPWGEDAAPSVPSAEWPAFDAVSTGTAPAGPAGPFPSSFGPWPEAKPEGMPPPMPPMPMHARDLVRTMPMQLHIRCSISDLEEVDRDQDRFKQQFVRAAAKAAGVPENRIRAKQIMNH